MAKLTLKNISKQVAKRAHEGGGGKQEPSDGTIPEQETQAIPEDMGFVMRVLTEMVTHGDSSASRKIVILAIFAIMALLGVLYYIGLPLIHVCAMSFFAAGLLFSFIWVSGNPM